MFEILLAAAAALSILAILCALDVSQDVFHPLVFVGPMLGFLYAWMPWKLITLGGLDLYFDNDQLVFVQTLNVLGILAFVACCLGAGVRIPRRQKRRAARLSQKTVQRLLIGGSIAGGIGLLCWAITIVNVGGFVNAYSASYSGGWDDSGYIRDGSLLLLLGVLMAVTTRSAGGPRWPSYTMMAVFGLPWLSSALLMARRGPTFALAAILLMGWYINRTKRPPLVAVGLAGACLGWLVLFLVTNRQSIYLGSNFDMKTDVGDIIEKPDTGNEWIYGAGTVLSSQQRGHYFWMRRYLAQVLVRPIPSAIWPTKYEDFGVPELLHNAGTGEGFTDALSWDGAVGSAPGIVADLWVEVWWLAIPFMGLLGWIYGYVWKKSVTRGGPWSSQFVLLSALSIYMVMQTMEAVIFRTLLLSIPCWLTWRWALAQPATRRRPAVRHFAPAFRTQPLVLRSTDRV
ncbi:hypothetical protein HNQ77_001624 [Silvibacterium bohemicum]|uniref:Oligosaccharide repeat unit polymerase n=1 Tax=Silvibacterium bohemicum TaxID=1577686 RepID=A0A841JT57_9BACT|nr:hypothetical protein [Silvibacterium bohemicum]MBB6143675.1 hypothetical protein [Silvibacterium bohemicum]